MQINESGNNIGPINDIHDVQKMHDKQNNNKTSGTSFRDRLQQNIHVKMPGSSAPKASGSNLRCENIPAAKEVAVRNIPYSTCDKIELHVLEGYTLKAKLDAARSGTSSCNVYVEMKDEEGNMKACLFDAAKLRKDSASAMEQIAYAVIESMHE